jgi:hypothetical protein
LATGKRHCGGLPTARRSSRVGVEMRSREKSLE